MDDDDSRRVCLQILVEVSIVLFAKKPLVEKRERAVGVDRRKEKERRRQLIRWFYFQNLCRRNTTRHETQWNPFLQRFFSGVEKLSSDVLFLLVARDTGNGSNLSKGGDSFFCDNFGGNFMFREGATRWYWADFQQFASIFMGLFGDFGGVGIGSSSVVGKTFFRFHIFGSKIVNFPKNIKFFPGTNIQQAHGPPPGVCTAP